MSQAQLVEHVRVGILQLREVDVLFDVLVLRTELVETADGVYRFVEGGRSQSVGGLGRSCIRGRQHGMATRSEVRENNDSRWRATLSF